MPAPLAIAPAADGGYVDDAVAGLQQQHVWVSPEVSGAAATDDAVSAQIGEASVGVAVFSDNAALEASGPEIVSQLAARTGYDTIVVAVGGDLSAGSKVLSAGEAMRIANQAEASAGGVEPALVQTVQTVVAESAPSTDAATGGVAVAAVAIVAAVVVAAAVAALAVRRARRSRRAARMPDEVAAQVRRLRDLAGLYRRTGAAGNAAASRTAATIDTIAANTAQLFARLAAKGDDGQRSLAAVEYADTLRRLGGALDRDYLLDILTHPGLWDDPDQRIGEVQEAADAVSAELVENIKQVNARTGLRFQVSLDPLMGGRAELREWDRAFDRASDDDAAPDGRGGLAD